MNKAFTREDDRADDVVPVRRAAVPEGTPDLITSAGLRTLKQRLALAQRNGTAAEVAQLQQVVASVVAAPRSGMPADTVAFGRQVTVRDENGKARKLRIVGAQETDPKGGRVSWLSPLGEALLGAKIGESVTVEMPRGDEELLVVASRSVV
jgi:transcription elongation GreA/GreB family factor